MDRALTILSRGAVTQKGLRDRLARRGFPDDVILETIRRVAEMGYLDDEDFSRQWVERRISSRPCGKILLKKELYAKGVARETVEKVLSDPGVGPGDVASAVMAAERWLSRAGDRYENGELAKRLASHLKSRGFGFETISEVVQRLTGIETE